MKTINTCNRNLTSSSKCGTWLIGEKQDFLRSRDHSFLELLWLIHDCYIYVLSLSTLYKIYKGFNKSFIVDRTNRKRVRESDMKLNKSVFIKLLAIHCLSVVSAARNPDFFYFIQQVSNKPSRICVYKSSTSSVFFFCNLFCWCFWYEVARISFRHKSKLLLPNRRKTCGWLCYCWTPALLYRWLFPVKLHYECAL